MFRCMFDGGSAAGGTMTMVGQKNHVADALAGDGAWLVFARLIRVFRV